MQQNIDVWSCTLCFNCTSLYDKEPIYAVKKLCPDCKYIVRTRHTDAVNGITPLFSFTNPQVSANERTEARKKRWHEESSMTSMSSMTPAKVAKLKPADYDELRARHEDEILNRVRYCLDNNLLPAYEHLHKAPGDDTRFMVHSFLPIPSKC